MEQNCEHSVNILERKKVSVTAVNEVDIFTQEKIVLTLATNKKLTIMGNSLKISAFSKQTGALMLEGSVDSIKYSDRFGSAVKKLFK